tara:strand:+ start:291 stop:605 length:315 start_codon:yes stop_codon:yes gene_type:complete
MKSLKSYKVIINKHETIVEDSALNNAKIIQNSKTRNKYQYTLYLVAKDIDDCLKRVKQNHFERFNSPAKSIEIERLKIEAPKSVVYHNSMKNLALAIHNLKESA